MERQLCFPMVIYDSHWEVAVLHRRKTKPPQILLKLREQTIWIILIQLLSEYMKSLGRSG